MNDVYEQIKFWIDLLQVAALGVLGIAGWQLRRDKSQDTRVGALEQAFADKVAEHEVRLTKLEEAMRHVPSSPEVARLSQNIKNLENQLERVSRGIDQVNQFLLNNK